MGMSWDLGPFCLWANPVPEFVTNLAACDLAEHESINARPYNMLRIKK